MINKSWLLEGFLVAVVCVAACTNSRQPANSAQTNASDSTKKEDTKADASSATMPAVKYHALGLKGGGLATFKHQYSDTQRSVILAINRVDADHLAGIDTLIVPDSVYLDINAYSPFPMNMPSLKAVRKVIFFSYPAEAFGAYDSGRLIRWGPTNMGRKADPTPTGLHWANWKAEITHSTVKDEWVLKWNVNVLNKEGVGWHQYALPGYPASHSCLRLNERDAMFLYPWADQWIQKNADSVLAQGTPAVIFGAYPFGGRKPWLALPQNAQALTLTPEALQQEIGSFLPQIMQQQQKRDSLGTDKTRI